jgi:hypothetical protein
MTQVENIVDPPVLDSGERRTFESGAIRDVTEDKGRCDLLPLDVVSGLFSYFGQTEDSVLDVHKGTVLSRICGYQTTGDAKEILSAIEWFVRTLSGWDTLEEAMLEVSVLYQQGAKKYDERNWQKGIPCQVYLDSGIRHFLKFSRGERDERHDRAFVWNMLGLLWTHNHHPELRISEEVSQLLK